MSNFVLDASAVLAVIFGEPGGERVLEALAGDSLMSAVNLAEVIAKLLDRDYTNDEVMQELSRLRFETLSFQESDGQAAGFLRASTRGAGLSLGDRACIALARSLRLPVMTADRAWARVNLDVALELIR